MAHTFTQIYIQTVFAVSSRQSLIDPMFKDDLYDGFYKDSVPGGTVRSEVTSSANNRCLSKALWLLNVREAFAEQST